MTAAARLDDDDTMTAIRSRRSRLPAVRGFISDGTVDGGRRQKERDDGEGAYRKRDEEDRLTQTHSEHSTIITTPTHTGTSFVVTT